MWAVTQNVSQTVEASFYGCNPHLSNRTDTCLHHWFLKSGQTDRQTDRPTTIHTVHTYIHDNDKPGAALVGHAPSLVAGPLCAKQGSLGQRWQSPGTGPDAHRSTDCNTNCGVGTRSPTWTPEAYITASGFATPSQRQVLFYTPE